MMKWVIGLLALLSIIFGILNGKIEDVSNSILNESVYAVEFFIYLIGGMCFWGGIMRIAEKSKITEAVSGIFKPLFKRIFNSIDTGGKAFRAICMNVTANMLGLGNAATPLGIEAMKELEKEDGESDTASDNMIIFTVLNTASVTVIPTTVASLRLKHGCSTPMDILPAVWIPSIISVTVGVTVAKIFNKMRRKK